MEHQIFTATVKWYVDGEEKHTFIVVQASSFTDAVSKIEADFGEDIDAIENLTGIGGYSQTISFGDAKTLPQDVIHRLLDNNCY